MFVMFRRQNLFRSRLKGTPRDGMKHSAAVGLIRFIGFCCRCVPASDLVDYREVTEGFRSLSKQLIINCDRYRMLRIYRVVCFLQNFGDRQLNIMVAAHSMMHSNTYEVSVEKTQDKAYSCMENITRNLR